MCHMTIILVYVCISQKFAAISLRMKEQSYVYYDEIVSMGQVDAII